MNEVILTVRAMVGAGYQVVFLKKRIKLMRRKARRDLSDKMCLLVQNFLYQLLLQVFSSCVCWITFANSLFLQFLYTRLRSGEYIIHGLEGRRFQVSLT